MLLTNTVESPFMRCDSRMDISSKQEVSRSCYPAHLLELRSTGNCPTCWAGPGRARTETYLDPLHRNHLGELSGGQGRPAEDEEMQERVKSPRFILAVSLFEQLALQ
jgi:hypothetical protein